MITEKLSRHARARMRQRGINERDVDLIIEYGTPTPDGVVLLRRDLVRAEMDLKRRLNRLRKLIGNAVIIENNTIVTAYHPCKRKRRRMLAWSVS